MNVTFTTFAGVFRLSGKTITGPDEASTKRAQAFMDASEPGPHDNDGSLAETALRRAGYPVISYDVEGIPDAAGADVVEWDPAAEEE
jgi:hypothetical protein